MVSVIIATYRRDDTLKRAIESVLNGTCRDIEILVVDDNNDPTWNQTVRNIVDAFSCDKIRYLQNTRHLGSGGTRNAGIVAAKGEYITFLDDDDLYLPQKIEHQLNDLVQADADFSVTDLVLYDQNEKPVRRRSRGYLRQYDRDSLLRYHLLYHITGTDTFFFKKEYLERIGGFPEMDVGDEFFLMKEAICAGGKFRYTEGCFVKAYVHHGKESGLSSGPGKIQGENNLFTYKKTCFAGLDRRSRRYIVARHHAVLAYAYYRMGSVGHFLAESLAAFWASPIACLEILREAE